MSQSVSQFVVGGGRGGEGCFFFIFFFSDFQKD